MGFRADNRAYEAWLREHCDVVEDDLDYKHRRMTKNPFVFLRATYFRWARTIEAVGPEFAAAPQVLAVGDLHVENFGTWRDAEGRLVWGINDFDEAAVMPYAYDLIRLATSARLVPDRAIGGGHLADAILAGYRAGLAERRPILLDEKETWMRPRVACSNQDRRDFWQDVQGYPCATPPPAVQAGLMRSLPNDATLLRFASRHKVGGGSLGRPRFVAIAAWCGGRVVREAKALVPSAWDWAHGVAGPAHRAKDLATGPYRSPDPWFDVSGGFAYRRIAADSRKVNLGDDAGAKLHAKLMGAMGFDLGAVHAADQAASAAIEAHLAGCRSDWLDRASRQAAKAVAEDFRSWTG